MVTAVSTLAMAGIGSALYADVAGSRAQFVAPPAPEQPLPFSHQAHLKRGPTCRTCHAMPGDGAAATLPATEVCMQCHAKLGSDGPLQRLKMTHEQGQHVEWARVYRTAPFVRFSHEVHLRKGTNEDACGTCHGKVRDMAVMRQVNDISMASCIACHQTTGAPVTCAETCHGEMGEVVRAVESRFAN